MEPYCVRGVVLAPFRIPDFLERLERIVIAGSKSRIDNLSCDQFWLTDTKIGGFDECAQHALGRNRMLADIITVPRMHAAEVLRPRPIRASVDDHAPDLTGTQFLWLGWPAEK